MQGYDYKVEYKKGWNSSISWLHKTLHQHRKCMAISRHEYTSIWSDRNHALHNA